MLINRSDLDRLEKLRAELFEAIAEAIAEDGYCKPYEGTFGIILPNYHEQRDPRWTIQLNCYVIGPNRHSYWSGATLAEALSKAEKDIRAWISK